MKLDYKVVDDFLPSDMFEELRKLLLPAKNIPDGVLFDCLLRLKWEYYPNVVVQEKKKRDWRLFNLVHMVYNNLTILSPYYEQIEPINELLKVKVLTRIKINMYPNTETLKEHGMHVDYPFPHRNAVFSINTCDGYTKLEDGTKVESVANRMLLFDGVIKHTSSTCTDQPVRMNINFNYFL